MLQSLSFTTAPGSPTDGLFGNFLCGIKGWDSNVNNATHIPLVNANLLYFRFTCAAPGGVTSRTLTVRVNGADTTAIATVTGTETAGAWQGNVALVGGQAVTVRHNMSGSPATASSWTLTFIIDTPTNFQSMYFSENGGLTSVSSPRYKNPFDCSAMTSTSTNNLGYVAVAGDIKQYNVRGTTNAGGQSFTFVLIKNGTVQDGTGGTVNTAFTWTPSGSSTSVGTSSSFTLPVSVGDTISLRATHTSGGLSNLSTCVLFESSSPKKFTYSKYFSTAAGASNAEVANNIGNEIASSSWGAVPGTRDPAPQVKTTLSNLYVRLGTAPNTGNTRNFFVRINNVNSSLTASFVDAETTKADTVNTATLNPGDLWNICTSGVSTPDASIVWIGLMAEVVVSGGGNNKGGKGSKGPGGKSTFGPTGMIFWDSFNGFGQ